MAKIIGSGSVTGNSTETFNSLGQYHLGRIGILITGTVGPATVRLRMGTTDPSRNAIWLTPVIPGIDSLQMTAAGLYLYNMFAEAATAQALALATTGADVTTDFNFTIFTPARP